MNFIAHRREQKMAHHLFKLLPNRLLSRAGFGLIEVMIALGIVTLFTLSVTTVMTQSNVTQARISYLSKLSILQGQMTSLISNADAWAATAKQVPALSCLSTPTTCKSGTGSLDLYGLNGKIYYQATNPKAGLTLAGAACAPLGSGPNCAIHLTLTWTIVPCTPGAPTCLPVTITGTFSGAPNTNWSGAPSYGAVNWSKYQISVTPGGASGATTLASMCTAIGGTFSSTTNKCAAACTCTPVGMVMAAYLNKGKSANAASIAQQLASGATLAALMAPVSSTVGKPPAAGASTALTGIGASGKSGN